MNGDSGYRTGRCLGIDGFSLRYSCLPPALSTISHAVNRSQRAQARENTLNGIYKRAMRDEEEEPEMKSNGLSPSTAMLGGMWPLGGLTLWVP